RAGRAPKLGALQADLHGKRPARRSEPGLRGGAGDGGDAHRERCEGDDGEGAACHIAHVEYLHDELSRATRSLAAVAATSPSPSPRTGAFRTRVIGCRRRMVRCWSDATKRVSLSFAKASNSVPIGADLTGY